MIPEKFYDKVTDEVLNIVLEIPLLHSFSDLDITQIKLFTTQFYYLVKAFPRYLGALIWKAYDENIRLALVDNLVDECGGIEHIKSRELIGTHPAIYRRITRALDISDHELEGTQPRPYTKRMLDELEALFINAPFIESFGGMAPGIESISYIWIDVIHKGLARQKFFVEEDLYYFSLHTVVDKDHSSVFKNAIIPYLNDNAARDQLRDGALRMVHAQKILFEGIASDI